MERRTFWIWFVIILLAGLAGVLSPAYTQTAVYGGRVYTPESFPRAEWCTCSMCANIRSQWAASTTVKVQETPVEPKQVSDDEYETRYRTETKTVYETHYRNECHYVGTGIFRRKICNRIPYQVAKQVTVRVPYKVRKETSKTSGTQDLIPTPMTAVRRVLSILKPTRSDVLIDAGAGDGRFVIEASKSYGCTAIGVEIDPQIVAVAKRNILRSRSRALLFHGDALNWDYSPATMVVIYQMPDLVNDIVQQIPNGVKVASYMHDIPGIETKEYRVDVDGQTKSIFVGVVGRKLGNRLRTETTPNVELTFGL